VSAKLLDRLPGRARVPVWIALRWVIAAVFAAAAIPKLQDPTAFAVDIDNYHLVPEPLIAPLAIGLPALELVVAIALFTGIHARGAAILALAMLVAFAGGMVQAMARGIDLDCGCFGSAIEAQVSGLTVARNVVLALACVPLIGGRPTRPRPRESGAAAVSP
jgi:putative oxidoreductase